MYYYILDTLNIPQKEFERQQTELQSLLTEFNINGEMARITPLRTIQDLVETAASRGAKTLIACGTDETFNLMLAAVKDRDFILGFAPFSPNTQLGKILGMTDKLTCAKAIAGRRIEKIDAAKINDNFFISYLELGLGTLTNSKIGFFSALKLFAGMPAEVKMRIDGQYTATSKMMGALLINTRGTEMCASGSIGNPQDGYLDLLILEKLSRLHATKFKKAIENGCYELITNSSSIKCKKIEFLEPTNYKIFMNGKEVSKFPVSIELIPGKIKILVGKDRTF